MVRGTCPWRSMGPTAGRPRYSPTGALWRRSRTSASTPSSSSRPLRTRRRSSKRSWRRARDSRSSNSSRRRCTRSSSISWGRTRRGRTPARRWPVRKVLAIIRREFIERVRSKWFWVGTILGPLLMVGLIGFQILLAGRRGGDRRIVVVDGTTTAFGQHLVRQLQTNVPRFHLARVPTRAGVADSLLTEVVGKQLDGFLLVSDSTIDFGTAEYRGSNVSSIADMEELQGTLRRLVFAARLERRGIDTLLVRQAEIPLRLATHKISGTKLTGESGEQSFMVGFGMAILLFVAILIYGVNVMSSVLEEKTTRVVELLISSLRPFQLMVGKVLGAGAVGLVQLTVWVGSARLL